MPETGKSKNMRNSTGENKPIHGKTNKENVRKDTYSGGASMYKDKTSNTGENKQNLGTQRNQGIGQRDNPLYDNMRNPRDGMTHGKPRVRPQALTQGRSQKDSYDDKKRLSSQKVIPRDNRARDDVFFNNRGSVSNRRDSSGYQFTRDQMKRMQYKNKVAQSNLVRLFVFNVPNKYNVDDVYDHFSNLGVHVKDLWLRSHPEARKKSFVVKMPKDEINNVLDDDVMESLNIRVREYTNNSDQ